VIHKQHPSSFTGTDLNEHLEKLGKKKIVLAGAPLPVSPLVPPSNQIFNIYEILT